MAQYQKTPFRATPALLVAGTPQYVFGSFLDRTGPTLGYVISDSGNGTTSTVVFQITSGNVPIVSATSAPLVTIVGTANSSAGYNATNATIATIAVTEQGVATITFLGTGNSASAQDFGSVYIGQPENGETIGSAAYSSVSVANPFNNVEMQEGKNITASVTFPTGSVSAATAVLQGANIDLDSEYITVGTLTAAGATGATPAVFVSGQGNTSTGTTAAGSVAAINFRFLRLQVTSYSGSGTVVGKILI